MTESKVMGKSVREISSSSDDHKFSRDSALFSSSLPVFQNEKLNVNNHENGSQSIEDTSDLFDLVKNLLPDDEDELFAGIMDGFHVSRLTNHVDDLEDYDLFGSGGGIEIESDPKESRYGVSRLNLSESAPSNGMMYFTGGQNCITTGPPVTGEHPAGEHPSRTLFVRNINSNVEDSELMELFQVYGDIRNLYTACKHRGFVMISYYDIRAARTALRALQNKPLRRRKLDIHFSIPKDNPSDKDLNQGTLVIFNLDPCVSNEDLLQIFGVYGEVKEIRETPLKRNHKFIEFYDTRASEAALRAMNGREIAGRSIKLEPSRPGGTRRNLLHIGQDQDQDEPPFFRHQMSSSFGHSPPGNWSHIRGAVEQAQLSSLGKSLDFRSLSPTMSNFSALASIMHPQASNSSRVSPTGVDFMRNGALERMMNHGNSGYPNGFHQSLSFPESKSIMFPGTASSFVASSSNGSGMDNFSGPQSIWGSPKVYSEPTNSSSSLRGQHFHHHPLLSSEQTHGFSFSGGHGPFLSPAQAHAHLSPHDHHVGSAPSERHIGFRQNPQEAFMTRNTGGINMMIPGGAGNKVSSSGSIYENTASNFGLMHSPRVSPMFTGNSQYPGITNTSLESFHDRNHNRRVENNENQLDNKQQFQLDLEKIKWGEDSRTTLMIKNIPNKYDSKMLLEAIDEKFQGTYDFLYLPIDFGNKCNVGYAFINMMSPSLIIPFYEVFNGKKWERFNSEKVASLAYARIQGKTALVTHFQNSSVMNEDKRCRPIVLQPEGADSGDQAIPEQFQVHKPNGSEMKELSGSPSDEIWYE